jgi:hypothetical protein
MSEVNCEHASKEFGLREIIVSLDGPHALKFPLKPMRKMRTKNEETKYLQVEDPKPQAYVGNVPTHR